MLRPGFVVEAGAFAARFFAAPAPATTVRVRVAAAAGCFAGSVAALTAARRLLGFSAADFFSGTATATASCPFVLFGARAATRCLAGFGVFTFTAAVGLAFGWMPVAFVSAALIGVGFRLIGLSTAAVCPVAGFAVATGAADVRAFFAFASGRCSAAPWVAAGVLRAARSVIRSGVRVVGAAAAEAAERERVRGGALAAAVETSAVFAGVEAVAACRARLPFTDVARELGAAVAGAGSTVGAVRRVPLRLGRAADTTGAAELAGGAAPAGAVTRAAGETCLAPPVGASAAARCAGLMAADRLRGAAVGIFSAAEPTERAGLDAREEVEVLAG